MSGPNGSWKFDRTVNLGDMLTSMTIAAGLFTYAAKLDTRVTVLEDVRQQQVQTDGRQDQRIEAVSTEMKGDLKEINGKLDRLIESQVGHGATGGRTN